jgi:molybdopterin molybdotransferase
MWIEGENVVIGYRPDAGENIRRHGEDVAEGAVIVPAGTPLAARHIGLLAANGIAEVTVCRKIRVAIFSTGDELERWTDLTRASSVYDANGPMLEALCASPMAEVEDHGVISDDKVAMTAKLRALADRCDLVLSSGGVSTGARDFLREALIAAGGSVEAHRVALKPGKPIAFGRLGRALYTGLPGNPFAAYVGFYLFVAGQIARLAGINDRRDPAGRAIWSSTVSCKSGRTQYLPARVTGYNGDLPIVELVGHGGSASLYPVAQADGLAAIPANRSVIEAGEVVAWAAFQNSTTSMGPL